MSNFVEALRLLGLWLSENNLDLNTARLRIEFATERDRAAAAHALAREKRDTMRFTYEGAPQPVYEFSISGLGGRLALDESAHDRDDHKDDAEKR